MGAPVARTKTLVYTLNGLLAGFAGALNAAWLDSGVTILGYGMELEAIAAVVIGGTLLSGGMGFVGGSLVGVLLLKVIQNVINQIGSLDSAYQQVVSGGFLVVVVIAQTWLARRRRAPDRPPGDRAGWPGGRTAAGRGPEPRPAVDIGLDQCRRAVGRQPG